MLRRIFHVSVFCLLAAFFAFGIGCAARKPTSFATPEPSQTRQPENAVNINTASAEELQSLPQIGPQLAEKIIEHRRRYGPFRRAEHLLIVDGMSERRFDEIRMMITVD